MAHHNIQDPDKKIPCPYNSCEMISEKRMTYHLIKCRKNHTGQEFAVCWFNATHKVPKPKLRFHMANCPDKVRVEKIIQHEQTKKDGAYLKGNTDLPDYSHNDEIESNENWDEEIPSVASIGVPANYFNKLDRRSTAGWSKAEKKEYKKLTHFPPEERIRHSDDKEKVKEEDRKLRMPHHKPQTCMGTMGQSGFNPSPSVVYAYSLSMSGIGRGQQVGPGRANTFESVSRGRGRAAGRGISKFPGQSKNNGYISKPLNTIGSTTPDNPVHCGGEMNSSGHTECAALSKQKVDVEAARARNCRRMEKKLRQIEMLEKKVTKGYKLTTDEEIKVESKKDIVLALEDLRV